MSREQNQKIVSEFLARFCASNVTGVCTLLHDEIIWKVMGREGGLPLSGDMDKAAIAELMATVGNAFPQGMTLTPSAWTIEGNRVAVEVESYGKKSDGTLYNNLYHFLFVIISGQIMSIREYMDTLHVKSVFIDD
jgi:ketosteroid isomerase-like protein